MQTQEMQNKQPFMKVRLHQLKAMFLKPPLKVLENLSSPQHQVLLRQALRLQVLLQLFLRQIPQVNQTLIHKKKADGMSSAFFLFFVA